MKYFAILFYYLMLISIPISSQCADLTNFDVLGVKLGSSAEDAITKLTNEFKLDFEKKEVMFSNGRFSMGLTLSYEASPNYTNSTENRTISISVRHPNTKEIEILESRLFFSDENEPLVDTVVGSLKSKYGPPDLSWVSSPNNSLDAYYLWASNPLPTAHTKKHKSAYEELTTRAYLNDIRSISYSVFDGRVYNAEYVYKNVKKMNLGIFLICQIDRTNEDHAKNLICSLGDSDSILASRDYVINELKNGADKAKEKDIQERKSIDVKL
ncbi:MAG: hypothetical protein VR65_06985 [Desulfobulbaceae bacterium BRH_c16a]|nr:MAG: hypothetical protein VR65_06985 [Desulfobulbaceae bacterium BRH_c16a]